MQSMDEPFAVKDLSSLDALQQRLTELWSKGNSIMDVISACEKDLTSDKNIKKRVRAQRELAQLREQAKEEVCARACVRACEIFYF